MVDPPPPALTQERPGPPVGAHQSLDAFAADPDAVDAQLSVDAVGAVGAFRADPDVIDVAQQAEVDEVPVAGEFGLADPGVVGRHGNVDHPKQERDRVSVPEVRDEPQDRRWVESSSWAKYALADFKISLI